MEDKNLLLVIQQRGLYNWFEIAAKLGTNRIAYQCLCRYQRSLNANILKKDWTIDDDAELCAVVEDYGESDWQLVASNLEGRTGAQCSNRWFKTLNPVRERVGRWTVEEDKRLKVAVIFFGPKSWVKIAQFVPGRTQSQCRGRWIDVLAPSLNLGEWTIEEDSKLKEAIVKHGRRNWCKVAACLHPRTRGQCRRRWKFLFPHEVPMLQADRKVQKAATIINFVDREKERPALGPGDFLPSPELITAAPKMKKSRNSSGKKQRKGASSDKISKRTVSNISKTKGPPCLEDASNIIDVAKNESTRKKRTRKHQTIRLSPDSSTTLKIIDRNDDKNSNGDLPLKKIWSNMRSTELKNNEDIKTFGRVCSTKRKRNTLNSCSEDYSGMDNSENVLLETSDTFSFCCKELQVVKDDDDGVPLAAFYNKVKGRRLKKVKKVVQTEIVTVPEQVYTHDDGVPLAAFYNKVKRRRLNLIEKDVQTDIVTVPDPVYTYLDDEFCMENYTFFSLMNTGSGFLDSSPCPESIIDVD